MVSDDESNLNEKYRRQIATYRQQMTGGPDPLFASLPVHRVRYHMLNNPMLPPDKQEVLQVLTPVVGDVLQWININEGQIEW